jgi:hypothetical protein
VTGAGRKAPDELDAGVDFELIRDATGCGRAESFAMIADPDATWRWRDASAASAEIFMTPISFRMTRLGIQGDSRFDLGQLTFGRDQGQVHKNWPDGLEPGGRIAIRNLDFVQGGAPVDVVRLAISALFLSFG